MTLHLTTHERCVFICWILLRNVVLVEGDEGATMGHMVHHRLPRPRPGVWASPGCRVPSLPVLLRVHVVRVLTRVLRLGQLRGGTVGALAA
jgi:hypothetical protein